MTHNPGDLLSGRYRLDEPIASGGMGDVWRGTDELLGRVVAIKVLHAGGASVGEGDDFRTRFRDEARHSAGLTHPNIATVYDFGEDEGHPYLVMELVEGQSLADLLGRRGPLPAREVAALLGQAALALEAAHSADVVHRDVKPANIMVTAHGVAKLTDFGIARAAAGSGLTRTGEVLGTPHYLSPEQALGQPATAASDVYALGVIGHELLTGHRPFDGESMVATALAHVNAPAPQLPATVPEPLRGTIMAALAKEPIDRPPSAGDVAAALGVPTGPLTPPEALVGQLTAAPAGVALDGSTERMPHEGETGAGRAGAVSRDGHTSVMAAAAAPAATAWDTATTTDPEADRQSRRAWLLPAAAAGAVLVLVFVAIGLGYRGQGATPAAVPTTSTTSSPPTTTASTTTATTASRTTAPATTAKPKAPAHQGKGGGTGEGGKKK